MKVKDAYPRYFDALYRHLNKHAQGELIDDESGLSHLTHAAWNMLAILELELRAKEEQADNILHEFESILE